MSIEKEFFNLNYKYRIYPNKEQIKLLETTLSVCKGTYNLCLNYKINVYSETKKYPSKFDTDKYITQLKKTEEFSWLNIVHSQLLVNISSRADTAYQRFFRKISKFPKFKSIKNYNSFTYPQFGYKLIDNKILKLSKIGNIKITYHREIIGDIKNLTIKRNNCGQWFAIFCVQQKPSDYYRIPNNTNNAVGIDIGISKFLTLSDGQVIENPRFLKKSEFQIKNLQRKASKKQKGSKNRKKAFVKVAKKYNHLVNQRKDFQYKVANMLCNTYDLIAMEDLNLQFMLKNHKLAKHCQDLAIYQFKEILKFKSQQYQGILGLVDPKNTSQICSKCGEIVPKELSQRVHHCKNCGCILDRDLNASINVLSKVPKTFLNNKNIYLKTNFIPKELGNFKSVEKKPLFQKNKYNIYLLETSFFNETENSISL